MKEKNVLKNGLTLITDLNEHLSTVTFSVYFTVGSAYENYSNLGITHLVEHMFFRQLNGISQKKLYFIMESLSGTINGFTTREYTCFEYTVIDEYAQEAFDLMKNILCDFHWTQEELEREKKIVIKEIELLGNRYDLAEDYQIGIKKYYEPIKGYIETVDNITLEDVNNWKEIYFSPENACFIVTGNYLNIDNNFKKQLSDIPYGSKKNVKKTFTPPKAYKRSFRDYRFPAEQGDIADVRIFFDVDLRQVSWICTQIVFDIFACGNGSKLSFSLKDTNALTDDIYSSIFASSNNYAKIDINWSVSNEQLFESLDLFFDQLDSVKKSIGEDELTSSINFSTINAKKMHDDSLKIASMYGFYDFIADIPFSVKDSVNAKEIICLKDIEKTAKKIFDLSNMFVCISANRKIIKKRALKNYFYNKTNPQENDMIFCHN